VRAKEKRAGRKIRMNRLVLLDLTNQEGRRDLPMLSGVLTEPKGPGSL